MGNVFSSLSPVPATRLTPRGLEEVPHQESETFQVECAVCLTGRLVFKKMHHSWSPETGHYVCFGCFRAWKRACQESRSEWPECDQLTCPLCGIVECYSRDSSIYVACSGCRALCVTEYLGFGSNGHVAGNHPGCALCWRCVTEAQECPICGLEGPLLADDDFEREWAQAAR